MSYLPRKIPRAKVLVTVKTYPLPITSHGEVVCTAGIMEDGKWIRIYPILFRSLTREKRFRKYQLIELDLNRKKTDCRPETYTPFSDISDNLRILNTIGTKNNWSERRKIVLNEVFDSFQELINLSKSPHNKSLATLKPLEIIDFSYVETDREWKPKWKAKWDQLEIFDELSISSIVSKVPYKFYYVFISKGDNKPRKLEIIDWEIGALYWRCLRKTNQDEQKTLEMVGKKYYDEFVLKKDLYFFVGTSYINHVKKTRNPFLIIGLFYPPKLKPDKQLKLFN